MSLFFCVVAFTPPADAEEHVSIGAAFQNTPPFTLATPPAFLACPPIAKETSKEKGKEGTFTPFIGTTHALTLLPTPERPAIAASDSFQLKPLEVTAGINFDLGAVKFNLGYTLPSAQVDELVRPFGLDFEPGSEGKCFRLGVKIPF